MRELSRESVRVVSGGQAMGGENRSGAGPIGAQVTAAGAGIGASYVIDAAGGLGALAAASPAVAMGAIAAYATGIGAVGSLGYSAGTWLYDNSATVRGVADNAVGSIMENGFWNTVGDGMSTMFTDSLGGAAGVGGRSPYMCYMAK